MEDNAVTRYTLFINIARLFQLIEVFIAVVLISWSSSRLPSVMKVSGEYLLAFSSNLLNQHVVFFVGNVIIVLCYVLSRDSVSGYDSEISDEKRSLSSELKITGDASIGELRPPVNETETEVVKETIMEEKGDQKLNGMIKTESDMAVETAIKQAAKQIDWFSRTQSAKLKREISLRRTQQELRRSATSTTAKGRRNNMLVTSFKGSSTAISVETVDKLSNEEFQLAVETFISKHQSFLKQQSMAENGIKF
ncbi:uncharacterized protein LOC111920647 [Lactuca sativa]|uniref:uncharacterized protein LOC111920647 n=1 Tax=Lactuca sativa TaxID=4236 RepID=UPI000CA9AFE5|nr:uncharacterized protein LOC111920647 [Lactuca sativa]